MRKPEMRAAKRANTFFVIDSSYGSDYVGNRPW
jgi:hypothetical protein